MKVDCAYFSKRGRKGVNEDFVLPPFNLDGEWWSAIADGMGGRLGGDIASKTAIQAINDAIRTPRLTDIDKLFNVAQDQLRTVAKN